MFYRRYRKVYVHRGLTSTMPDNKANENNSKGEIAQGDVLYDTTQQQRWIVGSYLGIGEVGQMYEAALYTGETIKDWNALVQIESHENSTSAQMEFYIKNASSADISHWKKIMDISHLGVPALLGSGSHQCNGQKYRFIVLKRYGTDLWKLFVNNGKKFPEHTVYKVALQILPVLEYIHTKEYFHTDVKGTNLLIDVKSQNHIYLVNFGLVSHYMNTKKILGSLEYASRDAHAGVLTARGDLESTFYNMIQWLCGSLPWEKNMKDSTWVQQQKEDAFMNEKKFLRECFKASEIPVAITRFMQLLSSMKSDDKPKYKEFSKILIEGLDKLNHEPSGKLEFAVKNYKKPMTLITSNWKLIKPRDETAGSCSQDRASESAETQEDLRVKESKEARNSSSESLKQNRHSTDFEHQMPRTDSISCSRAVVPAVKDRNCSGFNINEDHTRKRLTNDTKAKKVCATRAEMMTGKLNSKDESCKIVSKDTSTRLRRMCSDISSSQPPDTDTTYCLRQSRSSLSAKSSKRKMQSENESSPKCMKRSTAFIDVSNELLDELESMHDSGLNLDISSSQCSLSPNSNQNSAASTLRNTPLHIAVLSKNTREVNALLKKKASVNARDADGNTPLHLAFLQQNKQMVDVILAAMKKLSSYENVKNNHGLTTLHIACTRGNTEVIRTLLKSNAALKDTVSDESASWKGFTAVHFAAKYKSLEAMKILLHASSEEDREAKNSNGQTAFQMINHQMENLQLMSDLFTLNDSESYQDLSNFHVACARNDSATVKKFLSKGALVNTPVDEDTNICAKYTPIHFAIERKCEENVSILMQNGADLWRTNASEMTPLHQALYTEENGWRESMVDLLYVATENKESNLKDKNDLSYLHIACSRDDIDLVKKMLDANADINSRVTYTDKKFYHFTPLHFATMYENEETVQYLIARGADVNVCDDGHHGTPLHMAFEYANQVLVDMFLDNGANAKAVRPADKQTPLSCLVYGHIEINKEEEDKRLLPYVERLVMEFGVDVNAKDHEGDTALHIACDQMNVCGPVVELLLNFGADINAENNKGHTPFMSALGKNNKWDCDNADRLVILYNHVQKIKALGLKISEKNERCCEKFMKKRKIWKIKDPNEDGLEQKRQKEIAMLMNTELSQDSSQSSLSVYDLVMLEPKKYKDVAWLNTCDVASIADDFPIYGYLVRLQLRKIAANAARVGQNNEPDNIDVVN